ncbi:alpha/beta fold hydrolase [Nocardia sp. NPDC101769]|uniref:alpha/beta fold hydrolase n=1 Tax=Nocardia sp. NPDC101769 TaxID=3364333 RepID=UPI0038130756
MRTQQIVVGDVRSPVLVGGPEGGEAVVFIHGNPGGGSDWLRLMAPIAEFARVIAPDMPGFAGAEMRGDQGYTVADYARHLDGVIRALGVQRVHLLAHDFGGPWALTWAAQHPDMVASVTLINTGVLLDYRWHRLARIWRIPLVGELMQRIATPRLVRALLQHDNPGLDRASVARVAAHLRPWGTKRAVLRLYRSTNIRSMIPIAAVLQRHDLPCLVVWGADDVYLPAEQAYRQTQPFPSARIHTIAGAGHWVFLEQAERVAELVVPFLRTQLGGPNPPQTNPPRTMPPRPAHGRRRTVAG